MVGVELAHEIELGGFSFVAVQDALLEGLAILPDELCSLVNNGANLRRGNDHSSHLALHRLFSR